MSNGSRTWLRLGVGLVLVAVLAVFYAALSASGAVAYLREPETLQEMLLPLGSWGPLFVVGSMTLAIVFSPLPSAPIALAAGVLYGHTFGTLYVQIGAELGALIAFGIARIAGGAVMKRWIDNVRFMHLEGSQGTLMDIVFVTRLIPFISFDAVSYAAGLTPLSLWRFALATFVGILPASFLLGHFGAELESADTGKVGLLLLILGMGVLIPLLARLISQYRGS